MSQKDTQFWSVRWSPLVHNYTVRWEEILWQVLKMVPSTVRAEYVRRATVRQLLEDGYPVDEDCLIWYFPQYYLQQYLDKFLTIPCVQDNI